MFTLKGIKIRLTKASKLLYQDYILRNSKNKKIAIIVGCQRSGTTMLSGIFEKDLQIRNYSEKSVLSERDPKRLKLNPLPEVQSIIQKTHAPVVAMKPLVESQNTLQFLDFFENGKAIWVYRHYKDVAASNLKKFGTKNGINNLRPLVNAEEGNWRADNVSQKTRKIAQKYFSEDMAHADAAALFWYCRNILFFEQNLESHKRVLLCKYEDLVTEPKKIVGEIYSFLSIDGPSKRILSGIHAGSIMKGKDVSLNPEIENLCESLLNQINLVYQKQSDDSDFTK